MLGLQGKTKNTDKAAPSKKRGLKRRRISQAISPSATDTAESTESEESSPSSYASSVIRIVCNGETDKVYKTEPLDDAGANDGLSADQKGRLTKSYNISYIYVVDTSNFCPQPVYPQHIISISTNFDIR